MSETPRGPRTLTVVSHVPHFQAPGGRLWAYAPYAREIEIWADLFPRLVIAAPVVELADGEEPPGDTSAIDRPGVSGAPQLQVGGASWGAKLGALLALPRLAVGLLRAMGRGDAVHVRCPGNLGLLGTLLAPLTRRPRIAKYAGQWPDFPGELPTVRLQKRLLASRWWGAPVTVYGDWPDQPDHVVPFFTSVMEADQAARARRAARERFAAPRDSSDLPARLVFVGRLSAAKHPETVVEAVALLAERGIPVTATLVGDGPERPALEAAIERLGIAEQVTLAGAVPFDRVLDAYEAADLLVLVSETEGWPKAVAEAMAFGLVPVASDRGLIPWMVAAGEHEPRGAVVPPGDAPALADAIERLLADPAAFREMGRRAADWAGRFSLDGLRQALRELMEERWGVSLSPTAEGVDGSAEGVAGSAEQ
jgi:glycosyltransferase involved in cell wall biosynthesis